VSAVEALDIAVPPEVVARGLFERHSKRIFGFCVRRLSSREEAEDAVQTTFINALRALQRGVRPLSEEAWLFKIAENVCLATHRSNGRRRRFELAEAPSEIPEPPSAREDGRESAAELVKAMAEVPENQRRALLLREWRGLSYREIALELGVSVASVETLIFRARRRVARTMSNVAGVFDLGTILKTIKSALGGATAKIAAAAAVVMVAAALPAGDAPKVTPKPSALAPAPVAAARKASPTANQRQETSTQPNPPRARAQPRHTKPVATGDRGSQPGGPVSAPPAAPSSAPQLPSLPHANPPAVLPVSLPHVPVPAPELPRLPEPPRLPDLPVKLPDAPVQLPELPKLP